MSAPHVSLRLTDHERALLSALVSPWRDLLYAPGPDFASPLDPGSYRTSLVIVPATGVAIRVSSAVMPAFGGEVGRLCFEALPHGPPSSLGSFFDLARTGTVYALTPEHGVAAARSPDRAEWRYHGASLAPRLGRIGGLRLLHERGHGAAGSWEVDRGLVIAGADADPCLVLATTEPGESTLFLPTLGLYRPLVDPAAARQPGVTVSDLLGHGDRDDAFEITVALQPV